TTGSGGTTGSAGTGGATGSAGKTGSAGQASGGGTSGGSTGSGGKGGTTSAGGSTSGGSTGSGGSVGGNGVTAQYKVVSSDAMSSYIQCELYVLNAGPNTYAVSDLKVRYYYTDDVKTTTDWSLNWSHISTGGANQNVTVTEASMAMVPTKPNADTYFEFSFAPAGQSTIGPGQGIAFSWRFNATNQSLQYTQTNDYSFDASKTTQADWSHVVVLQNGTVIWGATP
ncbi:MAG TPA: cellulose binding domain-containing protein, partial [Polyangiaceae bacterium]|nr:cellulose binding domain-containing protein [Polyangiaceae bacterium]